MGTTPLDQLAELIDDLTTTLVAILGIGHHTSRQLAGEGSSSMSNRAILEAILRAW
jgi:hypothetical protein